MPGFAPRTCPAPPSFLRSSTRLLSFSGVAFAAFVRVLPPLVLLQVLLGPALLPFLHSSTPAYSKTSAAAASGRMQQERIRSPLPPHIEALRDIVVCIVPYQGRESTRLVVLQ